MSTIEFSITGDDGIRRVLVSNSPAAGHVAKVSQVHAHSDGVASLSLSDAWRASLTCALGFSEYLPIDPTNTAMLEAAVALRKMGFAIAGQAGDVAVAAGVAQQD